MKNASSSKWIFFFLLLVLGLNAKAELPPLTNGYPTFPLPHKFQMSPANQNIGYIDVDGFGGADFFVEFYSSGTGSSGYCLIRDCNSSYTGNLVLTEFYSPLPISPASVDPLSDKIPLSTAGEPFASLVEKGYIIGPLLTSPATVGLSGIPSGMKMWYYSPYIFQNPINPPNANLSGNYTNGIHSGYIGIQYSGNGGKYFGWLNVVIDDNEQWVLINSTGSASAPSSPVPAGLNDPFSVPIPIIASIFGFGLIGCGIFLKRRKKK
jgi:hypothetical protein